MGSILKHPHGGSQHLELQAWEIRRPFWPPRTPDNFPVHRSANKLPIHINKNSLKKWTDGFIDSEEPNSCKMELSVFGDGRMSCVAVELRQGGPGIRVSYSTRKGEELIETHSLCPLEPTTVPAQSKDWNFQQQRLWHPPCHREVGNTAKWLTAGTW